MNVPFGSEPIPGMNPEDASPQLTPDNARLCVLNGPGAGRMFSLGKLRLLVGRSDPPFATADIDLSGCELGGTAMVSRRHAEIQWAGSELRVVDLCSRNGTWVDGQRLVSEAGQPSSPVSLRAGSRVTFANLETEVSVHGG